MTNGSNNDIRDVPTTILTVDRAAIDWVLLRQSGPIVRYQMPYKGRDDHSYYPRMHNWYKQNSDFPCYLNTYGRPQLYVKYEHLRDIAPLSYEGRPLSYSMLNLEDRTMLPWIMKLLVADFFQIDGRFVSNADFLLWATADKDFVTGLKIRVNHNWREDDNEFVVSDRAARLRKLRPSDFEGINHWKRKNKIYYGRFYPTPGTAVFKQLKPDQLNREQLAEGIYELFEGSPSNRASLTFHSVQSLKELKRTRSFLLNQFIERFTAYVNRLGLPFRQKSLPMRAMHTKSEREMKERQLPAEQKSIYVVDDRINARRRADDFATRFCEVANDAVAEHDSLFRVRAEADLQAGDWVLRIQDYSGDEFDPETGILTNWQDNKPDFYARHSTVVKQTLNINRNSKSRQRDSRRKTARSWSEEEYLEYPVPSVREVKTELEVCRNQLLLKDVVMFPENVCSRLPQIALMGDLIFLYEQTLVHFDDNSLHFIPVADNLEAASSFVEKRTGWNLMEDIWIPSAEIYYYDYTKRPTAIEDTTKRPFIISRDFVWEILEMEGRVVHKDRVIRERLEALEEAVPLRTFYPPQPIRENEFFTVSQLQAYAQFLDQQVHESTISFQDLVDRYGKHIKDDRSAMLVEDGGFYNLLDIKRVTKFRRYLNECLGLPYESVRESSLFPAYRGLWYAPDSHHYVAGVKDSNPAEQERGHVLRKIIVHQGERSPRTVQAQLEKMFFPLLEVNFIRYRNYTVTPFPFRLLEMWLAIQEVSGVGIYADRRRT